MGDRLPELHKGVSTVPKGIAFTRYALALLRTAKNDKGGFLLARNYAEAQCQHGAPWSDTPELLAVLRMVASVGSTTHPALTDPRGRSPEVQKMIKAAVAPGMTTDTTWAGPLALFSTLASEFIAILRPSTIIGRLNPRRTPFNVRIPRATSGASSAWVGEGLPSPDQKMGFDLPTLGFAKISTIVTLDSELVRLSDPSAELIVRDELAASIAQFEDQQFIDPTVTASAGVHPASITNSAASVASTGSTVLLIVADVKAMFALGTAANIPYSAGAWIMNPRTAIYLSTLLTTGNIPMWPTIGPRGGTWYGLPVIVSANVPIAGDSTTIVALVDGNEIFLADDGGITLDTSTEATIQAADNPQTGAQAGTSLWQSNLIGLRANRYASWTRRHTAGVITLTGVAY
jgi:HK97 family phage major capsid protein